MQSGVPFYVITLPVALLLCLCFQQIAHWQDKSLAGRLLRLVNWAVISMPLSLIVVLLLHVFASEEADVMGCLSAVAFGVAGLLIALDIILVSLCGYKNTMESIRIVSSLVKRKKLIFARVSILKDAFLVAAKSTLSLFTRSFFMFVNAMYSGGMGIARFVAVTMHSQEGEKQIRSYRYVGIIISTASICYVLYSVRLFFDGQTGVYDMNVALVIALYTFVEFGINIREAIKLRKSRALEAKALRAISFASTLICFVLTQTAIMSFAAEGNNSFANALSGIIFGVLAALVGLFVIIDSFS
ncbi:MAG: hypothetical protein ACK5LL_06215 [Suipraeoptans sp.]